MLSSRILSIASSCKAPPVTEQEHPARTDSILARAGLLCNGHLMRQVPVYLDSAYRAFPQAGPGDRWKKYNLLISYYLNYEFAPQRARLYADSMVLLLKKKTTAYPEYHAWSVFAKGDVLMAERRYQEAFAAYYEGSQFALHYLDSCNVGQFTYKLGLVKYKQGQYQEALPYLRRTIRQEMACSCSTEFNTAIILPQSALNTIALSYQQLKQTDSALA